MDLTLPKWGVTMQEATVVRWLKDEGDSVVAGEPVLEVETDKVEAVVEAPVAGVLTRRAAAVGDVVAVGGLLGTIGE
jgi:pyruvate dehydrogenase E2 component (dihydrolipoamide acetyltransferase)